jgi:membrane protein required for colicin V production
LAYSSSAPHGAEEDRSAQIAVAAGWRTLWPQEFSKAVPKMERYDLIMLAVLTAATMLGAWQGMAWQLASITSVVLSYMVACAFREPVAALMPTGPPWDLPLAMLALYVGTSLVVWVLFQVVARFIDRMKLKEFDRQVGAVMGLAKGVLLCAVVTLFSLSLLEEGGRQAVVNSYSGYCIAVLFDRADPFIPAEISERLDPLLEQLDAARSGQTAQPPAGDPDGPAPTDFSGSPASTDPWFQTQPAPTVTPLSDPIPAPETWSYGPPGYADGMAAEGEVSPPASEYRSASDPWSDDGYRR